ncbi:hypothetical protein [Peribacillus frigoritolerans]|uniref:hypothetical protein n=1 Tax=Peribacillus frigoritolerans TaxID=450367 RepID=UPI0022818864|nr:hypothetical protein [Peribacillus frigoritolerans]MCY8935511.1 hypothetical protein [Peribacillus frigoritolerans]
MKRLGGLHFLVGIWVPVLLMAQAVIGIMMYVDGSGNEPMNRLLSRARRHGCIHHHLCDWRGRISDNGDIQKNSCLNSRYYLGKRRFLSKWSLLF